MTDKVNLIYSVLELGYVDLMQLVCQVLCAGFKILHP
jgi:hypothetical protein